jgi:DNA repair exonuclease SbcCD ATPase subunit
VNRLKEERRSLSEANDTLQKDLEAEIDRAMAEENRLSAEIDQLQDRLLATSEGRDRELISAKNKGQRLEIRVQELETVLEQRQSGENEDSVPAADLSILRQSLEEARKKEKASLQRETDLKASARRLKSRITELEREIHDLQITKINAASPRSSPSTKGQEEIRTLRSQLADAHKTLRDQKTKNRELERVAVAEEERKDLHEMLKSSTLEAESLALKLSDRDARVHELWSQLRRIREERAAALRKADVANRKMEALSDRHETAIDDLDIRTERKGRHEKEIKGLSKEIMWLRARLTREENFRKDLAWSKGLMELGERVRVAWYVSPPISYTSSAKLSYRNYVSPATC